MNHVTTISEALKTTHKSHEVVSRILEVYKGTEHFQKGESIIIDYPYLFRRYLRKWRRDGNVTRIDERGMIPLGRAIVFMRWNDRSKKYEAFSAKIIHKNEVYEYSPGGDSIGGSIQYLALQFAENLKSYDKKSVVPQFHQDFKIALKKSRKMVETPKPNRRIPRITREPDE